MLIESMIWTMMFAQWLKDHPEWYEGTDQMWNVKR